MTKSVQKKRQRNSDDKFFLYVGFHSVLTAIANFFKDD